MARRKPGGSGAPPAPARVGTEERGRCREGRGLGAEGGRARQLDSGVVGSAEPSDVSRRERRICVVGRIVSLSISLQRIKKAVLKDIAGVITDEYIVNPKLNEKYLTGEATINKEAYTTWRREAEGVLKWYIFGNPYSLYNPLFLYWKVDTNKIKLNDFYVGDTFVIHTPTLSEELKNKLLEENPLYKFDEDYRMYALLGKAMNDKNIKLGVLPQNYSLRFTFKMEDLFSGVFQINE